jgi:23S rRNA maturation-related 3'-5' exoribonuclease YhaM
MTIDINKYKREKRTFSGNTRDYRTTCEIVSDKETAIEYLISFIKDEHLSEKINDIMTNDVPDYFYEKPSSSSGKYHPSDERSKCGLVLHTCRVTKLVDDLCVSAQIDGVDRDDLIVAAILHDSFKYDLPPGNLHTVKLHCIIPGEQLDISDRINHLIRTHDGQWGLPQEWKDADEHQKLLHYADYISSRSYIHVRIP